MKLLALPALVLSFALVAAVPLAAQDLTITNARIVVGNGTVIEKGSIVVRGGKIESVARCGRSRRPAARSTRTACRRWPASSTHTGT